MSDFKYVPRTMDDPLEDLAVSEFQALVEHHEREQWVWDRVALQTENKDDRDLADYHRDAVRNFKELLAEEEKRQTAFERGETSE